MRIYLGNSHRARDGPYVVTDGSQEANFQAINCLVELLDLVFFGGSVVPLVRESRVDLRVYVGGFEWFGHFEGGCCGEGSLLWKELRELFECC